MKKFGLIILILLPFCSPSTEIETVPAPELQDARIGEIYSLKLKADSLFARGNFSCLKEALSVYQKLNEEFQVQDSVYLEKQLKAAILLDLKEKEIGIINDDYLEMATELVDNNPSLSDYSEYLKLVGYIRSRIKGTVKNSIWDLQKFREMHDWTKANETLFKELDMKSKHDEFFAYLNVSADSLLFRNEKGISFSHYSELFPDFPMLKYKLAIYPLPNKIVLNELLQKDSRFYEAYYFIGEAAAVELRLFEAERNYLLAYEEFPDSLSILISLANIYFLLEEFDICLQYNEEAIKKSPEYRDAILGKAMCLSYLDRNEEAIEELNHLLQLGNYLIGESFYWLAWNHNQLNQLDDAHKYIQESKNLLYNHAEVFSLSGIIAYRQNKFDVSQENLLKAVDLDPTDCEAAFYLGHINDQRGNWQMSGHYFERAGICYQRSIYTLNRKLKEIEDSSIQEERKSKFAVRSRAKIKRMNLKKATAFYNSAAGYLNAGNEEKALALADRASTHELFKDKVSELKKKIQK